jgi:hypothetical protein
MKTYQFEARQRPDGMCNWGKFMVGILDVEWTWSSAVDGERPLLRALGWWGPENIWVFDLQTGEGCFVRPGGSAHADLEKHAIWVCPLFEPWLAWLYERIGETGIGGIADLPHVVDLPDAEFALSGYRRPGPAGITPGPSAQHPAGPVPPAAPGAGQLPSSPGPPPVPPGT